MPEHRTYTMEEAVERLTKFEALLLAHNIRINRGGQLERLSLNIIDVLEKHKAPDTQDDHRDIRPWLREIVGMNHLIALILDVAGSQSFGQIVPHLRLLNDAMAPQNTPACVTDAGSNKLFELLLACGVMREGFAVTLDDPHTSKGTNPDVLVHRPDGATFGIACKCLHTTNPQTIVDAIAKGVQQILASPATRGVVALNVKNVFSHDDLFPIVNEAAWRAGAVPLFGAWPGNPGDLLDICNDRADQILRPLRTDPYLSELEAILRQRPDVIVPGVVTYVQTVVGYRTKVGAVPTDFGFIKFTEVDPATQADMAILRALNDGVHAG